MTFVDTVELIVEAGCLRAASGKEVSTVEVGKLKKCVTRAYRALAGKT